jgi:hypothetical protein
MPYLYQETYRGIGFHLTAKGYWFFNAVPPHDGLHRAWRDYFSLDDQARIERHDPADAVVMRRAINAYFTSRRA